MEDAGEGGIGSPGKGAKKSSSPVKIAPASAKSANDAAKVKKGGKKGGGKKGGVIKAENMDGVVDDDGAKGTGTGGTRKRSRGVSAEDGAGDDDEAMLGGGKKMKWV